jgi:hypothetical protein
MAHGRIEHQVLSRIVLGLARPATHVILRKPQDVVTASSVFCSVGTFPDTDVHRAQHGATYPALLFLKFPSSPFHSRWMFS